MSLKPQDVMKIERFKADLAVFHNNNVTCKDALFPPLSRECGKIASSQRRVYTAAEDSILWQLTALIFSYTACYGMQPKFDL